MEIPLLEKHYQQQIVEDKAFHEQQEEERVSTEVRERKEMDENRERMGRMESNRREFLNVVRKERQEAHMVRFFNVKNPLNPLIDTCKCTWITERVPCLSNHENVRWVFAM